MLTQPFAVLYILSTYVLHGFQRQHHVWRIWCIQIFRDDVNLRTANILWRQC